MIYLDAADVKNIERFSKEHPTGMLLNEMRNWKFQIGDVLIRHIINDTTKNIDYVSETCQVPKKYRVVYIDELSIPWIKQLSVRGGMGEKIVCLANTDIRLYRYQVDPEQLDAALLGHNYDPRAEYKRMRNNNPNYGRINDGKTKQA